MNVEKPHRHRWAGTSACQTCGWTKGRDVRKRAADLAYRRGYEAGYAAGRAGAVDIVERAAAAGARLAQAPR